MNSSNYILLLPDFILSEDTENYEASQWESFSPRVRLIIAFPRPGNRLGGHYGNSLPI